jgi:hypothetical protein
MDIPSYPGSLDSLLIEPQKVPDGCDHPQLKNDHFLLNYCLKIKRGNKYHRLSVILIFHYFQHVFTVRTILKYKEMIFLTFDSAYTQS